MTAPSVVFSADARPEAGGGHMSRCISLARALQHSCDVAFVLAADSAPHWRARLGSEGIEIVNNGLWSDVAVLDGYDLGPRDVVSWKQESRALVVIEDLGRHFAGVDLYVSYAGPPAVGARDLHGPQYALLDARFAQAVKPQRGNRDSILVTCGLRDLAGITGLYLDALAQCHGAQGKAVTIVLGSAAPHREGVQRQARDLGARVVFDVADMMPLYDEADLVLGAGGVSLFERMARGRASVTVVAADNQDYAAKNMAALGGTVLAGIKATATTNVVAESIGALLADRHLRTTMGALARQAIDGLGVERTAREILALATAQSTPAAASN